MKRFASLISGDSATRRGVLFMLLAVLSSTTIMAVIRYVSADLHPFVMAFFRSLFGLMVFLPLFVKFGWMPLKTKRPGLHMVRGALQVVVMLGTFTALSLAPLAKVTALRFSGPLFATLLALLILHEIIRARRISAMIVGFSGAMIILRPGFVEIDLGALLALAAAAAWAMNMIAIKSLSATESSSTVTIYAVLVTTPATFLAALPFWQTPNWQEMLWLVLIGALGSLSHWSRAQAFKYADITVLLPIDFTALVWAALFGYMIFGEVADVWTWLGGIVIFSSTSYITYRERQVRTERKAGSPEPRGGSDTS
ncbi:MAG: DMT family transporter [Rhodospirillales bacterium]